MIHNRDFRRDHWKGLIIALLLLLFSVMVESHAAETGARVQPNFTQTDVDRAEHSTDDGGVPILDIEGVGKVHHPAWIALYALNYAGIETYDARLNLQKDHAKFKATISWLKRNLKENKDGLWIWPYEFDSTYNDVSIHAPWSSAFAQAVGIQALLASYRIDGDKDALNLAKKAATPLITPIENGGLLFQDGEDIWFEEIPTSAENPSHILNGHMRALIALNELNVEDPDDIRTAIIKRGIDTLYRKLPLFDTGYWLRYDLNPKKEGLLFRFTNPYGFENLPLAIDKIRLVDPLTKEEVAIDVGAGEDSLGGARIAGVDWMQPESLGNRTFRRLVRARLDNQPTGPGGPHTYFYLYLPATWTDNLRSQWYELVIDYLDEAQGNITVQQQSIAPEDNFIDMRDGDLHLTGAGVWRSWRIPLRISDLGYWVGLSYAEKHAKYLKVLAQIDRRLSPWADLAKSYLNSRDKSQHFKVVKPQNSGVPKQSPMLPIYTIDKAGVVTQWRASEKTRYYPDGSYDPSSDPGVPVYSPFIVAQQILHPNQIGKGGYKEVDSKVVKREPAVHWLLDKKNKITLPGGGITYHFNFDNSYNDITTKAGWPSAFSQAYILDALDLYYQRSAQPSNIRDLIFSVAKAYKTPTSEGGIATISKSGVVFYEEVPNDTHVLNAHLASVNSLRKVSKLLKNSDIGEQARAGVASLKETLYKFDTGYWLRYDQNPKKEFIFQIDWLDGEKSPLISQITMDVPQTASSVMIDLGLDSAFTSSSHISGLEWGGRLEADNIAARSFSNGYSIHKAPVPGGTRQNTYVIFQMPTLGSGDYFDIQPVKILIKYKDIAPGQFSVKIQSINEGGYLEFFPLRGGLITTVGDQKWKTAAINLRPQDMGWYKGKDYQVYEVDQLEKIAHSYDDWLLRQYVEKQRFYLKQKEQGRAIVVVPGRQPITNVPLPLEILSSSQTYSGYGFDNALDADPDTNYVAGLEGDQHAYISLKLKRPISDGNLTIKWENQDNFAKKIAVWTIDGAGRKLSKLQELELRDGKPTVISLHSAKHLDRIRIDFSGFNGQPRLLLREIQLFPYNAEEPRGKNGGAPSAGMNDDPVEAITEKSGKSGIEEFTKSDLINLVQTTIFARLERYESGPLFAEMTENEARHGTTGNCAHTALWLAMELNDRNIPFRVLDVKASLPTGEILSHAMVEAFIGGIWRLVDPLNGWVYDHDILYLRKKFILPENNEWPGRRGSEIYGRQLFFNNIHFVEAYTDLAYTGIFPQKISNWRRLVLSE